MRSDAKRRAAAVAVGFVVAAVLAGGSLAQVQSDQPSEAAKAPVEPAKPAEPAKAPATPKGKSLGAAADTVRQLELAVEKDTTSFDKNYRLGVAYLDRDRARDAIDVFRRCTRLRPNEVKAWVNLGAAEDAQGQGADARMAYRSALRLSPDDEIALCRLGASHYAATTPEDRAAAMDTLRLALKLHPRSYCAYFTLGVAFADAQIYKEAIKAWGKVIEYGPNTPEAQSAKESIETLSGLMGNP